MSGRDSQIRAPRAESAAQQRRGDITLVATTPLAYREYATEAEGLADRAILGHLSADAPTTVHVATAPIPEAPHRLTVKRYSATHPIPLQQGVAVLDRFGLHLADYRAFAFQTTGAGPRHLQVFLIDAPEAFAGRDGHPHTASLGEALDRAWQEHSEVDGFSRLIFAAGLSSREVEVFRAYARFLGQIGHNLGHDYLAAALTRHPQTTRALIALFHDRFDPARGDEGRVNTDAHVVAREAIAAIGNDEDQRVLQRFLGVIDATLRTNYYQTGDHGRPKDTLAFKLDSRAIEGSPAPQPLYEIFVYSPRFEGIHLRGGKVARGGIRWSDRPQDYRTEVHGLFKAQMVKNVVIVPEGAKGGFVLKRPPAGGGSALRQEAIACYKAYVGALLDITDNLSDGRIVPPHGVVRHDGDDPYLVVAADKGTATFSDIANGVAAEYGFWLGDAFASGGSAGYDHKALGITARGAWEGVKRHFRELGIDAQHQPITVTGVGDMSGDVFGNGLLLSPHMQLVGAFDHRHIFVDPQPHPIRGFAERQRLFALPTSSWADFDPGALGPGGAVYPRDARNVTLSAEAQVRFGLPGETTPSELMRAILRTEVDLLWLGGIGTYIRAGDESDAAAGDRANDALRVSGAELRCKVVGEGANLGCTQLGRIEYARCGGRIDTDAIDNAGGVSCSDHEVNIKILLADMEAAQQLTRADRDTLLRQMSDDVCQLVLRDIVLQTQALSIAAARAPGDLGRHARLLRFFERNGQLDRRVAGLPDEEAIAHRRAEGSGLVRPELAVLLAHTKIALFSEFITSDLPDDPLLEDDLFAYFPPALRAAYPDAIRQHALRREIITTAVVNSMVNRVGSGFVNDIQERTGATDAEIARAYLIARRLFAMETVWDAIEELDTAADNATHIQLMQASREIIETTTLWLLRRLPSPLDISATVGRFAPALDELLTILPQFAAAPLEQSPLARQLQLLRLASTHLDILTLAERRGCGVVIAARMLFGTDEVLALPALIEGIRKTSGRNETDTLAAGELQHAASSAALEIADQCLKRGGNGGRDTLLPDYLAPRRPLFARYNAWRSEVEHATGSELAPAVLAVETLRALAAPA